jgi:glycosyltransferase involved in cell wall biosynthesis
MTKRIIIADPGMIFDNGHHRELNLAKAREFVRRGYHVDIFANAHYRTLPGDLEVKEIRVLPHFTNQPYAGSIDFSRSYGVEEYFLPNARVFESELKALGQDVPLLLSSAFPDQICGAAFAGWRSPVHAIIHRDCDYYANHPKEHWEIAFKEAKTLRRPFQCYVFEPALQKGLTQSINEKIRVLVAPLPLSAYPQDVAQTPADQIGILGGLRVEQGLLHVPMIVNTILASGFKVLLQDPANAIESPPHPAVKILGFVDDFQKTIRTCAAVVIHYDPATYATTSSAVTWEAMAAGTPILYTRGIASAQMLEKFGCGLAFDFGSQAQFATALADLKQHYPVHKKRSRQAARKFLQINGISQFVECLLQNGFDY